MTESFWNIPEDTVRTPIAILREQATALTDATKGLLQGEAVIRPGSGSFALLLLLRIKVPALNNYIYDIIGYHQPITLFPGMLMSQAINKKFEIASEEEFMNGVKDILASPETGKIIAGLLSQVKSNVDEHV